MNKPLRTYCTVVGVQGVHIRKCFVVTTKWIYHSVKMDWMWLHCVFILGFHQPLLSYCVLIQTIRFTTISVMMDNFTLTHNVQKKKNASCGLKPSPRRLSWFILEENCHMFSERESTETAILSLSSKDLTDMDKESNSIWITKYFSWQWFQIQRMSQCMTSQFIGPKEAPQRKRGAPPWIQTLFDPNNTLSQVEMGLTILFIFRQLERETLYWHRSFFGNQKEGVPSRPRDRVYSGTCLRNQKMEFFWLKRIKNLFIILGTNRIHILLSLCWKRASFNMLYNWTKKTVWIDDHQTSFSHQTEKHSLKRREKKHWGSQGSTSFWFADKNQTSFSHHLELKDTTTMTMIKLFCVIYRVIIMSAIHPQR